MRTNLMPLASVVLTIPKTAIGSEKRTGTRSDAKTSRAHNLQTNRRRAVRRSKGRRPSGIANWPASEFASIRPGARSMSCRAAAQADRSALPWAGMASSPSSRRAKQAVAVIDRIKRGENPVAAPPEPAFTVADLAERYMKAHVAVNCNAHTQGIYRGSLDNHILPALGKMPIASVGRSEAAALHYELRNTPRAANRALMVLSKMFKLAEDWGLASSAGGNPCRFRAQVQGRQARAIFSRRMNTGG